MSRKLAPLLAALTLGGLIAAAANAGDSSGVPPGFSPDMPKMFIIVQAPDGVHPNQLQVYNLDLVFQKRPRFSGATFDLFLPRQKVTGKPYVELRNGSMQVRSTAAGTHMIWKWTKLHKGNAFYASWTTKTARSLPPKLCNKYTLTLTVGRKHKRVRFPEPCAVVNR